MAVICTWSGDNAPLGTITNGTAGDGDIGFTHVNGTLTVVDTGTRPNRIQLSNSGVARCGWWQPPGYPLTNYAARFYLNINEYPNSIPGILRFVGQGTIGLTSSGMLTIRDDDAGTLRYTATTAIPRNQDIRIEATVAAGTCTVTAYHGDTQTVIVTGTGTIGTGSIDEVWYGRTDTANGAGWYIDDLALANTADLIGPAAQPAAPDSPYMLWTGTEYEQADALTWDGTGYVTVTTA